MGGTQILSFVVVIGHFSISIRYCKGGKVGSGLTKKNVYVDVPDAPDAVQIEYIGTVVVI